MSKLSFTVLGKPQPQGSMKAFMVAGKPRLTSDNAKMKPWRQEVGWAALRALADAEIQPPAFGEHVSVKLAAMFVFEMPKGAPKSRTRPSVKPDIEKIARALSDALTGIMWKDDAQVVEMSLTKFYGPVAHTQVWIEAL